MDLNWKSTFNCDPHHIWTEEQYYWMDLDAKVYSSVVLILLEKENNISRWISDAKEHSSAVLIILEVKNNIIRWISDRKVYSKTTFTMPEVKRNVIRWISF